MIGVTFANIKESLRARECHYLVRCPIYFQPGCAGVLVSQIEQKHQIEQMIGRCVIISRTLFFPCSSSLFSANTSWRDHNERLTCA